MRLNSKFIIGAVFLALLTVAFSSCTDEVKFGDSFLEKAPGGDVTVDTVFNNAEYTRQFLTGIYALQYYALPRRSSSDSPQSASYWRGELEALSDCFQLEFASSDVYTKYYTGILTSSQNGDAIFGFLVENSWELIRACYIMLENIDKVPGMDDSEKNQIIAETKCLLAAAYFQMFRHYGGLPLVDHAYAGNESSYNIPRATVEETVDFMVGLLDEAIASSDLPWVYTGSDVTSETGHWTKAGAMALKCKILQFAASPLFNATTGYYGGETEAEQDSLVWYGNYDKSRWTTFLTACQAFFSALTANGGYSLVQPAAQTQEAYRYAYRTAYWSEASKEVIHSVRVTNSSRDSKYAWLYLRSNDRLSYEGTAEFAELFPWRDGTPFDWYADSIAGKLDTMFVKGDTVTDQQFLQNRVYTRDPRLYETLCVNGQLMTVNDANGNYTGQNYEIWVGGTTGGTNQKQETGQYATGYRLNKYRVGDLMYTSAHYQQWVAIRLADMYLTYAEALIQANGDCETALTYINAVRSRVGLCNLEDAYPDESLTSNTTQLLERLLEERARELGFEDIRYYDMVRYKRSDLFENHLHGLRIWRLVKNDAGEWEKSERQWYSGDRKTASKGDASYYEPSHFAYYRFPLSTGARVWWDGFDPKWYLQAFPLTEINKDYGLIQNPGW